MAKETKIVTLQVKGIALFPDVAGACVSLAILRGAGKKVTSIELFQHSIAVRSEHESTDELTAWASALEPELRAIVDRGPVPFAPLAKALPRSAEG